jgi:hypothetical protein
MSPACFKNQRASSLLPEEITNIPDDVPMLGGQLRYSKAGRHPFGEALIPLVVFQQETLFIYKIYPLFEGDGLHYGSLLR